MTCCPSLLSSQILKRYPRDPQEIPKRAPRASQEMDQHATGARRPGVDGHHVTTHSLPHQIPALLPKVLLINMACVRCAPLTTLPPRLGVPSQWAHCGAHWAKPMFELLNYMYSLSYQFHLDSFRYMLTDVLDTVARPIEGSSKGRHSRSSGGCR